MTLQPVILWTDALLFVLLAGLAVFALVSLRHEHLRAPWRAVMQSRMGAASAVVLAAFAGIGVLDSLHYRERLPGAQEAYSGEVLSALDALLGPLRTRVEKTYSQPFAAHLYAKESVRQPDGRELRDYPRLQYGAAHLANPEAEFWADAGRRGAVGAMAGGLGLGLLGWLVARALSPSPSPPGGGEKASPSPLGSGVGERGGRWRRHAAALLTLVALGALAGALVALAPHYHILGTDKVGQDVLYLSLKSIRTGLMIGTLTTLVVLPLGIALGCAAGYFGGWIDDVIQYVYTTLNSIPGVLLIAAAVLVVQVQIEVHAELFDTAAARSDVRLLALTMILGATGWTGLARLLRAETLKLRELEFVQAAHAFGVRHGRILARHLLPNVMHLVVITTVIDFSGLVLAEAVLSYVGVGVDPVMPSFGNMINGARLELAREPVVWWQLAAAFAFMFALVLSANLFADSVRDAFDPRRVR
jgi:peptide/nickel transport system permease protein